MIWLNTLQSGLAVGRSQRSFNLIKKWRYDGVNEPINKFDGIGLVDYDSEYNPFTNFIEYSKRRVIYLFEVGLFSLGVNCNLSMILFNLMLNSEYLFIHIAFVWLAEDNTIRETG